MIIIDCSTDIIVDEKKLLKYIKENVLAKKSPFAKTYITSEV